MSKNKTTFSHRGIIIEITPEITGDWAKAKIAHVFLDPDRTITDLVKASLKVSNELHAKRLKVNQKSKAKKVKRGPQEREPRQSKELQQLDLLKDSTPPAPCYGLARNDPYR